MTSILKCTLKKSLDVTKKLVLCASYIIVALAGVFFAIYGAMWVYSIVEWPLTTLMIQAACVVGVALGVLVSLPWYVYAGLLVVVGIVGYSFAWCVARELTEEDKTVNTFGKDFVLTFVWSEIMAVIGATTGFVVAGATGSVIGVFAVFTGVMFCSWTAPFVHYYERVHGERKP